METLMKLALIAFIILAAVYIVHLIVWIRAGMAVRSLVKKTDDNLQASLSELTGAMRGIRKVTDDAAAFTENVKELAETAVSFERGAKKAYDTYRDEISAAARAEVAGVRAGIKTGIIGLFKNLSQRKGGSS